MNNATVIRAKSHMVTIAASLILLLGLGLGQSMNEKVFEKNTHALREMKFTGIDAGLMLAEITERLKKQPYNSQLKEAEGLLYFSQGNYQAAVGVLSKLSFLPASGNKAMALSYHKLNQDDKALPFFQKIPKTNISLSLWDTYCQLLIKSGDNKRAALEYEYMLTKYPEASEALNFLIDYYRKPLQKPRLIQKLQLAVKLHPNNPLPLKELAGLYEDYHPMAIDLRRQYLKLQPQAAEVMIELAKVYEHKRMNKEAMDMYIQAAPYKIHDFAYNLELADKLMSANSPEKAMGYYETCVGIDPGHIESGEKLSSLYHKFKQNDKAITLGLRIMETSPKNLESQKEFIKFLKSLNNKKQYKGILLQMEKISPKSPVVACNLSWLFIEEGNKPLAYDYALKTRESEPEYTSYLRLIPEVISRDEQVNIHFKDLLKAHNKGIQSASLFYYVARGYALKGNTAKAASYYKQAWLKDKVLLTADKLAINAAYQTGDYAFAGDLSKYFLTSQDPNDATMLDIRAESIKRTQSGAQSADDELRSVLEVLLRVNSETKKWWLTKASLDLNHGDTLGAIKNAVTWVDKHPSDINGFKFLLPLTAKRQGHRDTYRKVLEQLVTLEPEFKAKYTLALGFEQYAQGDFEAALSNLQKVSGIFKINDEMWLTMGLCEDRLQNKAASRKYISRAYEINQRNMEAARAWAKYLTTDKEIKTNLPLFENIASHKASLQENIKLAKAYFFNSKFPQAADIWEKAIEKDPALPNFEPLVADTYFKTGQYAKALPFFEARHAQDPQNIELLQRVADLYMSLNLSAQYVTALDKMTGIDPAYNNCQLKLARQIEKTGDVKRAVSVYQDWVTRNLEDMEALKSLHALLGSIKDTSALISVLESITSIKGAQRPYHIQLAELKFYYSRDIANLIKVTALYPDYKKGRDILVTQYHNQSDFNALKEFQEFMEKHAAEENKYLSPLADLHIHFNDYTKANETLFQLLMINKKDKDIFNKVYSYGKQHKSPHLQAILETGNELFAENIPIIMDYAELLGPCHKALALYRSALKLNPENMEAAARGADIALKMNNNNECVFFLRQRIALDKSDLDAYKKIADVYEKTAQLNELTDALEKMYLLDVEKKQHLLRLANTYLKLKKTSKATGAYARALSLMPRDKEIQKLALDLVSASGNHSKILNACVHIQNLDPLAHDIQFKLAGMYLGDGYLDRAYTYLALALENDEKNELYQALLPKVITQEAQISLHFPLLRELLSRQPDEQKLKLQVAVGYSLKGQSEKAAELYISLYNLDPGILYGNRHAIIDLSNSSSHKMVSVLCEKYLSDNNSQDREIQEILVKAYESSKAPGSKLRPAIYKLVSMEPVSQEWWYRLAQLDLESANKPSALTHGKKWLALNPHDVEALKFIKPLVAGDSKETETYARVLRELITQQPQEADICHLELGNLLVKNGQYAQSIDYLTTATQAYPQDALLWYHLGVAESKVGHDGGGAKRFTRAYKLMPRNITYARAYGASLTTDEELKAHLKLFKMLITESPSQEEKIKTARACFLNGEYAQALEAWEAASINDAGILQADIRIAQAYVNTSQFEKAISLYEIHHEKNPSDIELLEILTDLYKKFQLDDKYLNALNKIVALDPACKRYQLTLAHLLNNNGRSKDAAHHYQAWVLRHPGDLEALKALHGLAITAKDTVLLMEVLELMADIKSTPKEYRFQLAEMQFQKFGDLNGLITLTNMYTSYNRGRYILINEYFKNGQITQLKPFEKFMTSNAPNAPQLWGPLADFYAAAGNKHEAGKAYLNQLKNNEKNRSIFDKVYDYVQKQKTRQLKDVLEFGHRSFPQDIPLQMAFAALLKDTPEALDIYTHVIGLDKRNLEAVRRAALISHNLQNTTAAKKWLKAWTELEPTPVPWKLLTLIYQKESDSKNLALAYENLSALEPNNNKWAYQAGIYRKNLGDKDKALELFMNAAAIQPEDALSQKEAGLLLADKGQWFQAREALLITEKAFGFSEETTFSLYLALKAEGDIAQAVQRLKQLNSKFPEIEKYAFPLADQLYEKKQLKEFLRVLSHGSLKEAMDAPMCFKLLHAYIELKLTDEADALTRRILRLYPTEAETSLDMAIYHYQQNRRQKAQSILDRIISQTPGQISYYYRGRIAFDKGDWSKALISLNEARGYKDDIEYLLGISYKNSRQLAQASLCLENHYAATGRQESLKELLEIYKSQKDNSGLLNTLERLVAAFPEDLDYRVSLAEAYLKLEENDKARRQFQYVLKINPHHPGANLVLGKAKVKANKYRSGAKMLSLGLEQYSNDSEGWTLLGQACEKIKDKRAALEAYDKALKIDNNNKSAALGRLEMVQSLQLKSRLKEALIPVVKLDPQNTEAVPALAQVFFFEDNFSEAAPHYEKAVQFEPENKQYWENYAVCLLKLKDNKRAMDALHYAIQYGSKSVDIHVQLARLHIDSRQMAEAEYILQDILSKDPGETQANYWMGYIARQSDQFKPALEYFIKALKTSPKNSLYLETLAETYFKMGEYAKAASTLETNLQDLNAESSLLLAECYKISGKRQKAIVTYANAYKKQPTREMLLKLSGIYQESQIYKESIKLIDNSSFKHDEDVKISLTRSLIGDGECERARVILKSLTDTKNNMKIEFLRGLSYFEEGFYKKAVKNFANAIKADPSFMEAYEKQGQAFLKLKKPDNAVKLFSHLISSKSARWQAKGYLRLSSVLESQKDHKNALDNLLKSVNLEPDIEAMYALTRCYLKSSNTPEAENWARKARTLDQAHPYAILAKALILRENKKEVEALKILAKAIEEHPRSCDVIVEYAKVNWTLGNLHNVSSNSKYAQNLCPEMPTPYLLLGYVAHKDYDSKEAKRLFKSYLRLGGDQSMLPLPYQD